jgi:hypothetical protein
MESERREGVSRHALALGEETEQQEFGANEVLPGR